MDRAAAEAAADGDKAAGENTTGDEQLDDEDEDALGPGVTEHCRWIEAADAAGGGGATVEGMLAAAAL